MQAFDIAGPLPTGTTLLEASAGTGKTWTIAALATRYVASGDARVDELLVVTFTRAASQELRDRVRGQLADAARVLTDPTTADPDNTLHGWLLDADEPEISVRRERLTDALTSFDAATIATIHQFCQLVLRGLGVAGDTDPDAVLVEDLEQLTGEVVDDLYLARFSGTTTPPWDRATAMQIARAVVDDPGATVEPMAALDEQPDSVAAARVRFARDVLDEVETRKRRLGILSYNDLLSQLADALEDEDAPARLRMRHRWKIALIDEFQDTDPVQWQVFERAFAGVSTLVLIGDPKQAIYAFRGGDIASYLRAAELAGHRQTLGTNFRSDAPLLAAVQSMLEGAELGSPEIVVHPVQAKHTEPRLHGAGAPLRMRVVRRHELGVGPRAKAPVDRWRDHVVTDLARDVKKLLTSGATFEGEPLQPGQVAVLAARRATLQAVQKALQELGVPAVVNAGGSVFHTPAATEWLTLLEALEQPHRSDRVRAAALTSFFPYDAAALDRDEGQRGGALTDELAEEMRTLASVLNSRGVAAVMECAVLGGLTARVLAVKGGERTLTDLRHIGEMLHRVAVSERMGVVGLVGWLREQVSDEKLEVASERTRRLDSDAEAVQLVTIHGSKGLEYPVVYLPTLWDRWTGRDPQVALFHDAEGHRCRDVGGPSPFQRAHLECYRREDAGESLRLLYVALTRAQSQVVAWYAPSNNTPASPLHRMLLGRTPGMASVPDEQPLVDDQRLTEIFGHWRDAGAFSPELANHGTPDSTPLEPGQDDLDVRVFTRPVDTEWRRTSYSSLSAASAHHAAYADGSLSEVEPDEFPETGDAETLDIPADGDLPELLAVPSPMADLPVGATFGSLVHAVLEHADPGAPDWPAELRRHVVEQLEWWAVPALDVDALVEALVAVSTTPTGPLTGGRTLLEMKLPDRLREMDFELPLAGGDVRGYAVDDVRLGDLAPLLRRHLPEGDPLLGYATQLESDPLLAGQALRGYLTGSIDVVLRVEVDGQQRFVTVDYKTNWLGDLNAPLTAHAYRPDALAEAMAHSDYPLQALLYTVVLHRYLRWRLPDYDPATHLGGVLYLYLRGMCGPETPEVDGMPCGAFSWRAPVGLVEELSALLDGQPVTDAALLTTGRSRG
ncbi:UvrD-helicase domain-containing protein [Nocardioides jishulii]|uniref:RecBCD enzyme subunit RecB n=1 Tax=Nocardioides jishulii TaxID=2575440 RepID=A0A4U2YSV6_9ACTN|nr:UvrD-helicase domain-containing protein [Nocardioides jishulii]QCX28863.1 exodeoxyribonuclease V subunit beta [Nocardioides jishulii]TKI64240.1 exodeoxyribonuclease V subunit beta [Nocardioides jishulii]